MVIEGIIKKDEERFLKPLMKVKDFKNEQKKTGIMGYLKPIKKENEDMKEENQEE